jgi:hypothetical protein
MILAVSAKAYAVAIMVSLALAGCKHSPQKRVEIKQQSVAEVKPVPASAASTKQKQGVDTSDSAARSGAAPRTPERIRESTRETPEELIVLPPAKPAGSPSPAPRKLAKADSSCGLEAYPWPRPYERAMADAPRGSRRSVAQVNAEMAIDSNGNITHLRFTRLSSLDSVNRSVFGDLKKQHYKPTVLNGERVSVCSTANVLVHFQ